jgi:hypothetical protein
MMEPFVVSLAFGVLGGATASLAGYLLGRPKVPALETQLANERVSLEEEQERLRRATRSLEANLSEARLGGARAEEREQALRKSLGLGVSRSLRTIVNDLRATTGSDLTFAADAQGLARALDGPQRLSESIASSGHDFLALLETTADELVIRGQHGGELCAVRAHGQEPLVIAALNEARRVGISSLRLASLGLHDPTVDVDRPEAAGTVVTEAERSEVHDAIVRTAGLLAIVELDGETS